MAENDIHKNDDVHSGKKVLIADDDPDILELTGRALQKRGMEVLTARDGREALESVKVHQPDIILTDVLMPGMDGYALFKELRKCSFTSRIPIVVITGRGQMKEPFDALGVEGFIQKPFSPEQLYQEIRRVLQDHDLSDSLRGSVQNTRQVLCVVDQCHEPELKRMKQELSRAGFDPIPAVGAADAVGKALDVLPMWAFVDVQLTDKPAAELVYILRHIPRMREVKIYGLSFYQTAQLGNPDVRKDVLAVSSAAEKFIKAGAEDYLGKYSERMLVHLLEKEIGEGGGL
ncbi:MAG: response regulator [Candidatus Omnitrophota bacterium]